MRIYTASKFENYHNVRLFNDRLREHGHTVTWDWTRTVEFDDDPPTPPTAEARAMYGMLDYAGVMACDLLIMLDLNHWQLNGGRWEAGMAIGAGKDVWIVNYAYPVIFDTLPQVQIVSDEDTALSLLGRATAFA